MLKQALLVAGVLSFAVSASALELTNPFRGPAKSGIDSTTSYEYATGTVKQDGLRAKSYNHIVTEALSYGLTDSVSLDVSVSNTFQKNTGSVGGVSDVPAAGEPGIDELALVVPETAVAYTDRDDKNIDFEIGSTWNVLTGPTKVQVKGAYGQKESNSDGNLGTYKYAKAGVKAGHTYGIYTPYVAGSVELPVFQNDDADNHVKYEGKAGVYVYCPRMKTAVDTGARVRYDETYKALTYTYDLEVSYYVTKNVAVSAFGSYVMDGQADESTDIYGSSVGARLRVAF